MKIEQIYTGCLSQGAYYIESEGQAAIIDPLRETAPYLQKAAANQSTIKYIFETHFHADFVSGHLDLAQKTGAQIVYGPLAETTYQKYSATDGEIFTLGKLQIQVLHTPGHTPESTTYLLFDEAGEPHAIFTGDTLFIGDVGRPDLAQKTEDTTPESMAGMLYDSLRNKILPLPDSVLVYPAHGAGSACGKSMSRETWDILGNQKKVNYALDPELSREDFIAQLTLGLLPPPQYFAKNAKINKTGYESIDQVLERGALGLSPKAFEAAANEQNALMLDVRNREDFVKGFIPNAIFIGLDGSFAPWVGFLVQDLKQPILIIAPEGRAEEAVTRLARVGYDQAIGYLDGGIAAWKASGRELDEINTIDAAQFHEAIQQKQDSNILDLRKPGEWQNKHLAQAQSFPLDFINENMSSIQKGETYFLHCAGGYRSTIGASILKARGFEGIINVQARFSEIVATGIAVEQSVEVED